MIAQEEKKLTKIKQLTSEVENLERLKAGALAKAKQTVEQLKATGISEEAIHDDENYKKCLTAYKDFNSTLSEKQERISELEADIEGYKNNISDHKIQLQQLLRDVEKVKAEAADTVADVITAKQEKELAETFAGIAKDGTAEELQNLREMRQELKAEAKITKELAGTDTKSQEAEFLEYARQSESTSEFDALIGLASEAPAPKETNKEKEDKDSSALPE